MTNKADQGRLYERVARELAARIADGTYPVGRRLPSERELTQIHGVSRPTVREAIIALELDGLVEVRTGSGVYVLLRVPPGGKAGATDVGPFELLEARHAFESEACALAASRITEETLGELDQLAAEMNSADVAMAEDADRRFHLLIAVATQNSVMASTVEELWDARARSPQYKLLSAKAHAAGVAPRIDEHREIVAALRTRKPEVARRAMRQHLGRVLASLLAATEVQEIERARAKVAAARQRYASVV
ncbi:MAG: GntR family transcriptional regulator [Caulobacteraceae bacterium]|nr:GntR family transcriptional regulator [Caulobacteraceae bacterium]